MGINATILPLKLMKRFKLKELAQQLIAHSQQLESEEQISPTDSVGSVNHDPTDLFQDAQDPYSGHDLDSI